MTAEQLLAKVRHGGPCRCSTSPRWDAVVDVFGLVDKPPETVGDAGQRHRAANRIPAPGGREHGAPPGDLRSPSAGSWPVVEPRLRVVDRASVAS